MTEVRYECEGCHQLFPPDKINAILSVCPDKHGARACPPCTPYMFQGALDHVWESHRHLLKGVH